MKEKIRNNWSLKLLSVGIAIIIWLLVVNYDNPYMTRTITGIPIEILNEETITGHDMVYTVSGSQTASVRVRCPRKIAQALKASDFRAEADFNNIYTLTNQVPVTITCTNTRVSSDEITQLTQSLKIELEQIKERKMDVKVNVEGEPAAGYQVGNITCSPAIVSVKAPQSFLDQISYVGVEISVDGIFQTLEQQTTLLFYNAGGGILDYDGVDALKVSTMDIYVEVEILNVKSVGVAYTVTGQDAVASGYQYSGVELSPSTVEVSGRKSALADVVSIQIPDGELDVTGARENIVKTFDLREMLPEGVTLVNEEEYELKVTLKVERLETKSILLNTSDLHIENLDDSLVVDSMDSNVSVRLEGLASDLNELDSGELMGILDLSGLGEGEHTITVGLEVPVGYRVVGTPAVKLVLAEKKTEESQENQDENPDESSAESSSEEHGDNP
ncbi:MAG: CdaR family protein [Clostridiales bacterium]|nr:CdaR family protein [Clostridiales bacterium]